MCTCYSVSTSLQLPTMLPHSVPSNSVLPETSMIFCIKQKHKKCTGRGDPHLRLLQK